MKLLWAAVILFLRVFFLPVPLLLAGMRLFAFWLLRQMPPEVAWPDPLRRAVWGQRLRYR